MEQEHIETMFIYFLEHCTEQELNMPISEMKKKFNLLASLTIAIFYHKYRIELGTLYAVSYGVINDSFDMFLEKELFGCQNLKEYLEQY